MAARLAAIFFTMILVDNYVLVKFLGICPFLGVSKKLNSAFGMSCAVIFVMTLATAVTWPIQNFLLTPVAAVSTFTVPLAQIADTLGVSALAPTYSLLYGLDQYILPYEYAVFLYFFSTGYIHLKNLMQVFAVRALLALILLVAVFYPYWCLTGAI